METFNLVQLINSKFIEYCKNTNLGKFNTVRNLDNTDFQKIFIKKHESIINKQHFINIYEHIFHKYNVAFLHLGSFEFLFGELASTFLTNKLCKHFVFDN